MTVAELIEALKAMPQDAVVFTRNVGADSNDILYQTAEEVFHVGVELGMVRNDQFGTPRVAEADGPGATGAYEAVFL